MGDPYLLTGASGFLGRIVHRELSQRHDVVTLGRSPATNYRYDLAQQVPQFRESFSAVIHVAGKAHRIPRTKAEADEFFQVNCEGTRHLLQGLESAGALPRQFLLVSSVAVYGRDEGEMIDEQSPLLGKSPYAQSKIQAEAVAASWCEQHEVKPTILRLPLVVGPDPPGNLGAMVRAIQRGRYIGIGTGAARKSMVLAEDVARFIPTVIAVGGTYNLTDGVHPSMRELEHAIAHGFQRRDPMRAPAAALRLAARVGDFLGDGFPLNSEKFEKMISTLTYSDARAREFGGWTSRSVIACAPQWLQLVK